MSDHQTLSKSQHVGLYVTSMSLSHPFTNMLLLFLLTFCKQNEIATVFSTNERIQKVVVIVTSTALNVVFSITNSKGLAQYYCPCSATNTKCKPKITYQSMEKILEIIDLQLGNCTVTYGVFDHSNLNHP